jgi:hypothetical protein
MNYYKFVVLNKTKNKLLNNRKMETKKLSDLKLSSDEEKSLNEFVGKAVLKNAKFPLLGNRVGVSANVTIQDIVSSNDETIRSMGKHVNKLLADSDSEFDEGAKEISFSGIKAVELKDALKLILKHKAYKEAASEVKRLKNKLKSERDLLKTPEERRKEIDAELAAVDSLELEEA